MYELFDDGIAYERGGFPTIEGIEAFRSFYEGTRAIERGAHTVELLVVSPPWTIVRGRFEGSLRGDSHDPGLPTSCSPGPTGS